MSRMVTGGVVVLAVVVAGALWEAFDARPDPGGGERPAVAAQPLEEPLRAALAVRTLPPADLEARRKGRWEDVTYLPERGVRGLWADHGLTPGLLEALTGEPAYLSGPHGAEFVFTDHRAFGHYNPAFVRRLMALLEVVEAHPPLRHMAQEIHALRLRDMAHAYRHMHDVVSAPANAALVAETIAEYQRRMTAGALGPDRFGTFPYDVQLALADGVEARGLDFYEAVTAAGFWLRRRMDGTEPLFRDLLDRAILVLEAE